MFWRRCFYCRSSKDVKKVNFCAYPGSYYERYYHDKCIEECLCHPEDKTNGQLRIAGDIVKELKRIKGLRKQLVESVKALCKEVYDQ